MSHELDRARTDVQELLSEWRARPWDKSSDPARSSDEERAAALRDYQRMVQGLDDVLREQESERRSGINSDK